MNPARLRLLSASILLSGGAAAALSACAWSVPADPGRNAARFARTEPAAYGATAPTGEALASGRGPDADPAAGEIYARRCAQCHAPFDPATFTAGEWPTYVDRYGPRAGLFGAERARVLAWLQAHAR